MKLKRILKKYKNNLTPPSKENVLPDFALTKRKRNSFAVKRFAAAALSACLVLTAVLILPSLINENDLAGIYPNKKAFAITLEESGQELIGEHQPKMYYYIPVSDNSYELSTEDYDQDKRNPTDIGNIFFEKSGKTKTTVKSYEIYTTPAKEETDGNSVSYTPGITTITLYIEGSETLDDLTLRCLVNTMTNNLYARYVILHHNDTRVEIDGKKPEEGFLPFDLKNAYPKESPAWAEDGNIMVEYNIKVVDINGNPVRGAWVYLEYVSGEYGAYQPGYALTDKSGTAMREVHPNAVYNLYVQQKSCVSYTSSIVSDVLYELQQEINVTGEGEVTVVWDSSTYEKKTDVNKSVKIKVTDKKGNPVSDLFVDMFTDTSISGQVQLGYTDDSGEIMWNNFVSGDYILVLRQRDYSKTEEHFSVVACYNAVIEENSDEITLVWTGKHTEIEILVLE